MYNLIFPGIVFFGLGVFFIGRSKANSIATEAGGIRTLHSLPAHHGVLVAMSYIIPALLLLTGWKIMEDPLLVGIVTERLPDSLRQLPQNELTLVINEIKNVAFSGFSGNVSRPAVGAAAEHFQQLRESARNMATLAVIFLPMITAFISYRTISTSLRARNLIERVALIFLICCSAVAILTTIGIVLSVLFEALRFFQAIPINQFLFGLDWSPQMAIRADQAGSSGALGAVPVFVGTLLIASLAMTVAIPIGLLAAIYLSEYAGTRLRTWAKPILEILAGIPTVVYGFFAALTVAPFVRDTGHLLGLTVSSESALAAGLVMGVMIIPFVSSLSDDVIHAVPQAMRDGSLGLGATKFETILHVIIPAALPGIVGSVLLAVSRAIGETMIVVMAAGLSANLSFNPLTAVTTVTVQIVTLLVGDQEFDSPKTLAAFALGLTLFVFTLILNFIALKVVRKYREQYE